MIAWVENFSKAVQYITSGTSKIVSYFSIIITITISFEVLGRYLFHHPTSWVWPVNRQLFGIFILVALAYTESKDGHIRIEIFYDRFPPVIQKILRWFSLLVMLSFIGVLVWQTSDMAINAIEAKERASGAFKIPLYPFKSLIPLASLLIAVEIIISFFSKKEK
jgi:TRAP-type C4-dicarboxylate transport system permease small subunit